MERRTAATPNPTPSTARPRGGRDGTPAVPMVTSRLVRLRSTDPGSSTRSPQALRAASERHLPMASRSNGRTRPVESSPEHLDLLVLALEQSRPFARAMGVNSSGERTCWRENTMRLKPAARSSQPARNSPGPAPRVIGLLSLRCRCPAAQTSRAVTTAITARNAGRTVNVARTAIAASHTPRASRRRASGLCRAADRTSTGGCRRWPSAGTAPGRIPGSVPGSPAGTGWRPSRTKPANPTTGLFARRAIARGTDDEPDRRRARVGRRNAHGAPPNTLVGEPRQRTCSGGGSWRR